MNSFLSIPLTPTPEQTTRLLELQRAFAEVCNALSPQAQQSRCWNRVTLHHLMYHPLRAQFPQMGSQMVCNAIYSVSRAYRLVLQHPDSPWNLARLGEKPIPLIRFMDDAPVYFDRHTLSLKGNKLSMYTLDGRMRFELDLSAAQQASFHNEKLREIVLARAPQGFSLSFHFSPPDARPVPQQEESAELPEYLAVIVPPDTPAAHLAA